MWPNKEQYLVLRQKLQNSRSEDIQFYERAGLYSSDNYNYFGIMICYVIFQSITSKLHPWEYDNYNDWDKFDEFGKVALVDGGSAHNSMLSFEIANAIDMIWKEQFCILNEYHHAKNKLKYLASLPGITSLSKYDLAQGFGEDYVQPSETLKKIALASGYTINALFSHLSKLTGDQYGTINYVLCKAYREKWIKIKDNKVMFTKKSRLE